MLGRCDTFRNGDNLTNQPECDQFQGRQCDICNGTAIVDGKPVSAELANWYRARWGLAPIGEDQASWNVSMPSRGLGDSIAKITHYTGIAAAVDFVSTAVGVPCGCGGRQESLNQVVPFGQG